MALYQNPTNKDEWVYPDSTNFSAKSWDAQTSSPYSALFLLMAPQEVRCQWLDQNPGRAGQILSSRVINCLRGFRPTMVDDSPEKKILSVVIEQSWRPCANAERQPDWKAMIDTGSHFDETESTCLVHINRQCQGFFWVSKVTDYCIYLMRVLIGHPLYPVLFEYHGVADYRYNEQGQLVEAYADLGKMLNKDLRLKVQAKHVRYFTDPYTLQAFIHGREELDAADEDLSARFPPQDKSKVRHGIANFFSSLRVHPVTKLAEERWFHGPSRADTGVSRIHRIKKPINDYMTKTYGGEQAIDLSSFCKRRFYEIALHPEDDELHSKPAVAATGPPQIEDVIVVVGSPPSTVTPKQPLRTFPVRFGSSSPVSSNNKRLFSETLISDSSSSEEGSDSDDGSDGSFVQTAAAKRRRLSKPRKRAVVIASSPPSSSGMELVEDTPEDRELLSPVLLAPSDPRKLYSANETPRICHPMSSAPIADLQKLDVSRSLTLDTVMNLLGTLREEYNTKLEEVRKELAQRDATISALQSLQKRTAGVVESLQLGHCKILKEVDRLDKTTGHCEQVCLKYDEQLVEVQDTLTETEEKNNKRFQEIEDDLEEMKQSAPNFADVTDRLGQVENQQRTHTTSLAGIELQISTFNAESQRVSKLAKSMCDASEVTQTTANEIAEQMNTLVETCSNHETRLVSLENAPPPPAPVPVVSVPTVSPAQMAQLSAHEQRLSAHDARLSVLEAEPAAHRAAANVQEQRQIACESRLAVVESEQATQRALLQAHEQAWSGAAMDNGWIDVDPEEAALLGHSLDMECSSNVA